MLWLQQIIQWHDFSVIQRFTVIKNHNCEEWPHWLPATHSSIRWFTFYMKSTTTISALTGGMLHQSSLSLLPPAAGACCCGLSDTTVRKQPFSS